MDFDIDKIYRVTIDTTKYGSEKVNLLGKTGFTEYSIPVVGIANALELSVKLRANLRKELGEEEYYRRLNKTLIIDYE